MSLAAGAAFLWQKSRIQRLALLLSAPAASVSAGLLVRPRSHRLALVANVRVAGVQMEFPSENEVLVRLNDLLRSHPETRSWWCSANTPSTGRCRRR